MRAENVISKRKRLIPAVAAMVAVAIIAGSLAYWNQTHTIENPFETGGKFGSTVIEDFTPRDEWQPGAKVTKAVRVENTGEQDIIVRVKMDEKWIRKEETIPYKEFKAEPNGDVYKIGQANSVDGLTAADNSVVIKHLKANSNWVDGGDGWYYYNTNLKKKTSTDNWLESVELLNDLDVGAYEVLHFVTADEEVNENTTWVAYNPAIEEMPKVVNGNEPVLHSKAEVVYKKDVDDNDLIGYLNSNYTLTITTQTVQATQEAVLVTFGINETQLQALDVTWDFAD